MDITSCRFLLDERSIGGIRFGRLRIPFEPLVAEPPEPPEDVYSASLSSSKALIRLSGATAETWHGEVAQQNDAPRLDSSRWLTEPMEISSTSTTLANSSTS